MRIKDLHEHYPALYATVLEHMLDYSTDEEILNSEILGNSDLNRIELELRSLLSCHISGLEDDEDVLDVEEKAILEFFRGVRVLK